MVSRQVKQAVLEWLPKTTNSIIIIFWPRQICCERRDLLIGTRQMFASLNWVVPHIVQTLTTRDCKGPQTNMPKNVGSIKTWSENIKEDKLNSANRILQWWSYICRELFHHVSQRGVVKNSHFFRFRRFRRFRRLVLPREDKAQRTNQRYGPYTPS